MANHKSAEKRNRQRVVRTERARAFRSRVRSALKQARLAMADASGDAVALVKAASSLLDRAATKGNIPKKRAARIKGRLTVGLNAATKG